MKHTARWAQGAISAWLAAAALLLGLGPVACGGARELEGGLALVSIAECEELGGAPLFAPDDERPPEHSCPDGLEAIAVFDEDFYGSRGGVCCTGDTASGEVVRDEGMNDPAANDDAANDDATGDDATGDDAANDDGMADDGMADGATGDPPGDEPGVSNPVGDEPAASDER